MESGHGSWRAGLVGAIVLDVIAVAVFVLAIVLIAVDLLDDPDIGLDAVCAGAVRVDDEAGDVHSAPLYDDANRADEDSIDIRQVQVHAGRAGLCVRWVMADHPDSNSVFEFDARSRYRDITRAIGDEATAYGFHVYLKDQSVVDFTRASERDPPELEAVVIRSGSTVSVFVPYAELVPYDSRVLNASLRTRAQGRRARVPERRLPRTSFSFQASVGAPTVALYGDSLAEATEPRLGYVRGRLCRDACGDLDLYP